MDRLLERVALRARLASRSTIPTLWYENEVGDRWKPPLHELTTPPSGYIYQHSRFPTVLQTRVLRLVQRAEVDACVHPPDMLKPDLGLIEGFEGRECLQCHGSQIKEVGQPWPATWDANGSRDFFSEESSWPADLVLAMVRPTPKELAAALKRLPEEPRQLGLEDAILLTASACERCLNGLYWCYGLTDGYPPFSKQWWESNTKCTLCTTPGVWSWLLHR